MLTTTNKHLSAWLLHNGFVPEAALSPDDLSKVEFRFEKTPELEDAIAAFYQGSARVNPVGFKMALDQVHDMIRAALRDERRW